MYACMYVCMYACICMYIPDLLGAMPAKVSVNDGSISNLTMMRDRVELGALPRHRNSTLEIIIITILNDILKG